MNFDEAPLLVIWETTQACDLACVHCRACAIARRHPAELTTEEGCRLLDEVKAFNAPTLLVFTGGDPLKRPDLFPLIRYSVAAGLRTNVSPSATPLLTSEAIDRFKDCGLSRLAISLDGADALTHDSFRQVPGTFDRAMAALRHAREIGLETQIQTTVTRRNMRQLPLIAERVAEVKGRMWSLFFLIVTGRAQATDDLTGEEYEQVFETLYRLSKVMPFEIKTTEAMHYRRYIAQKLKEERGPEAEHARQVVYRTAGVSDGRGFVFISHTGEIYPSGFLPISAGNVRSDSLVDVYRNSALFRSLRDLAQRKGKCGHCEYTKICGGSRARAYAQTGDYLAEDPRCVYQPVHEVAYA
ncbi:MAG: TIGR04053 family radical SAM/SPASM domain-containing protein [Acidobacteria bacterium]|nr:TIGR04053 family radical SAM/SPASM domain-containing protein [Acidobacteriota bacterium]